MKIWNKFYECECKTEGIMIGKTDDYTVHLAIFRNSFYGLESKSWRLRLRAIWDILVHGTLWTDNIILNLDTAKELGKDLIKQSEIKRYETKGGEVSR